ncbi:uncharacterized protein N7458_006446 [Penicillium daleae]|uniref:Uncharacterized protein n=1 Tax=Penicillium daleae TaxID=63821 RepID=A0AAD6G1Q8_9EURO|nr:uncharacterized protein N7458_006446 [Penicillium daleae]KAJ5449997.1 hypothetical protein N7458_006446 [Penicillium daleae]
MSSFPLKNYSLLTSFTEKIILLLDKHANTSQSRSDTPWDINPTTGQSTIETAPSFGIEDGHLDIMERVYSLHTLARETGSLDPESISQALTIWDDLEHLEPPETLDSSDYFSLHASCVSALFVWLYLVVHPEGMKDEKVQTTVYTGLVNAENISDAEFFPFLLIPAFCLGIASIRQEDREFVRGVFGKAERSGISKRFREMVIESWNRWDSGVKRSWDWGDIFDGEKII